MIKVLYYAEELSVGGVENMMFQWIKHSLPNIHIDIMVSRISDKQYAEEFKKLGCRVYEAKCKAKNLFGKYKYVKNILSKNKYDIVHVHTSLSTDFFILMLAKRKGIRVRIAHSHNVPVIPSKITRFADRICKPLLRHYTTDYFGCSKDSIIALFGEKIKNKKYSVIKNGIETVHYRFSNENYCFARNEFNAKPNDFVIGSVGRLDYQKDYSYLLRIIDRVKYICNNVSIKVVLIGEGDERNNLIEFSQKRGIDLLLLGKRSDVNKLLCGFDLFVLTSRYEGFPVVMMEAQANGLDCVVSKAIPQEALLGDSYIRVSKENKTMWINAIMHFINKTKASSISRIAKCDVIKRKGYDIESCAEELSKIYISLLKSQKG